MFQSTIPFGCQNGMPGRAVVEVEEIELLAELAMVAALRLLQPLEVRVEILLRVEGGAVDPRQLRVLLVAAPVRAREAGELEGLDRLRVLEVRAAAEVGELALRVERDVALGRVDELDLVRLALDGEALARLVARDLLALPLAALGELAADLLLDPLEVGLVDRLRELEVVVEAVLDRRADGDLHARIEPPHRLGEQVRRRVAEDVERVRVVAVARREDLDLAAVRERQPQVLDVAVRAHEHRLLGELGADGARGVEPRRAFRQLELRLVGEDDLHPTSAPASNAASRASAARCQRRSKNTAIQIDISNKSNSGIIVKSSVTGSTPGMATASAVTAT